MLLARPALAVRLKPAAPMTKAGTQRVPGGPECKMVYHTWLRWRVAALIEDVRGALLACPHILHHAGLADQALELEHRQRG